MIELVKFTTSDIELLNQWIDSPKMKVQWAGPNFAFPLQHAQINKHIQPTLGECPKRYFFKVLAAHAQPIGVIELNRVNLENGTATICRVLVAPGYRKQGYGVEMMKEVLRFGFDKLKLRRVELDVFSFNADAIQLYRKIGFVEEGVKRAFYQHENEYWDLIGMGMLREEWELLESGSKNP